jgi:hypothetical protein
MYRIGEERFGLRFFGAIGTNDAYVASQMILITRLEKKDIFTSEYRQKEES